MKNKLLLGLALLCLSGCGHASMAVAKGAWNGFMCGPLVVDEVHASEVKDGSFHTESKKAIHAVSVMVLISVNPIIGGIYWGGSIAYGAYTNFRDERKALVRTLPGMESY